MIPGRFQEPKDQRLVPLFSIRLLTVPTNQRVPTSLRQAVAADLTQRSPPGPCLALLASQDKVQRLLQTLQTCRNTCLRPLLLPCRPNPTAPTRTLPGIDGLSEQGSEAVAGPADLPEHVIVAMLKRENLLTRAKLNALFYDHITGERQLRKLKTELRQVGSQGLVSWGGGGVLG